MPRCRLSTGCSRLFLLLFVLATATGCGGGNNAAHGGADNRLTGRATFSVFWPAQNRLIPVASNSIKVEITNNTQAIATRILAKPTGGGMATATFDVLPTGNLTVAATAYPQSDATGVAQATAIAPLLIQANKTTAFSLTMTSTIDHLDITPPNPSVVVGQAIPLIGTARDAAARIVLITPGKMRWSSSDSKVATVDANGRVTGVKVGTVTITVKDTESGKSGSATLHVTAGDTIAYVTNNPNVAKFDLATGAFLGNFILTDSVHAMIFGADGLAYIGTREDKNEVRRYNGTTGAFVDVFISSASGGLSNPIDLRFGQDGNLYVASAFTNDIKRYNSKTGAYLGSFASGSGLDIPTYFLFRPDGKLYVSSSGITSGVSEVKRFDSTTGAFIDNFVTAGSGGLQRPYGLAFGPDNNFYVCSTLTHEILRYNGTTGAFIDSFVKSGSGGLIQPVSMEFGTDGKLYVVDATGNKLLRYNGTTGGFIDTLDPANAAGLNGPDHIILH